MDALKDFFQKYNAVPATDRGPDFARATDAALLGWAEGQCRAWDGTTPEGRAELLPQLKDLRRETFWRAKRYEYPSEPRAKLNAAWWAVCRRIGVGGDE